MQKSQDSKKYKDRNWNQEMEKGKCCQLFHQGAGRWQNKEVSQVGLAGVFPEMAAPASLKDERTADFLIYKYHKLNFLETSGLNLWLKD